MHQHHSSACCWAGPAVLAAVFGVPRWCPAASRQTATGPWWNAARKQPGWPPKSLCCRRPVCNEEQAMNDDESTEWRLMESQERWLFLLCFCFPVSWKTRCRREVNCGVSDFICWERVHKGALYKWLSLVFQRRGGRFPARAHLEGSSMFCWSPQFSCQIFVSSGQLSKTL